MSETLGVVERCDGKAAPAERDAGDGRRGCADHVDGDGGRIIAVVIETF